MSTGRRDTARGKMRLRELRRALAGRDPLVSPHAALSRLWKSPELRGREALIRSVLEDIKQPAMIRQTAAVYLGRIDRPSAVTALKKALRVRDLLVRGAVLRALGRIGDREALAKIRRLRPRLRGWNAREAEFAITLLAYRHGIEGHEVPLPREGYLYPEARRSREIRFRKAPRGESEALSRSLKLEPLGISVSLEDVYQLICGARKMLVVLNRDVVVNGDVRDRFAAPAVPSLVVNWHEHDEAYAPIFYLLTHASSRDRGRVHIAVLSSTGRLLCAGDARLGETLSRFSIRAVAAPGNTPTLVEGTLERSGITLKRARAGLAVRLARQVVKGPR